MSTREPAVEPAAAEETEHFKPTGTVFLLIMFVITMILLWGSSGLSRPGRNRSSLLKM